MPITREKFEKGEAVPGVSNSILHFLIASQDKAFSLEELENGMLKKVDQNFISAMAIDEALGRLVRLGLVENKRFKNSNNGYTIYYSLKTAHRLD
jgi:hypothetical protein